ncbi:uncharacterized protein MEPE_00107 [Melanopsichium pennsylvanicum]|uniref:Uncharacterized protein n=2 Tax=Melanopsichium pennsylvanicum TaxID=63383 RepID=A0AAJ4XFZ7_9BASI|nr:uncharacterized protein BN887_01970 [Melanopsichium pennsylvanicum 4]SNX81402.1 uncharacterized protein MEPE_00107 [Melanopsichium pennsylvanicum]
MNLVITSDDPPSNIFHSAADNVSDNETIRSLTQGPRGEQDRACLRLTSQVIKILSDSDFDEGDFDNKPDTSARDASASLLQVPPSIKAEDPFSDLDEEKPKPEPQTRGRGRPRGPRGSTVLLTEVEQAQIISLKEAGLCVQSIAEHLARPPSTVYSFVWRRIARNREFAATLPGSANSQPYCSRP